MINPIMRWVGRGAAVVLIAAPIFLLGYVLWVFWAAKVGIIGP